MNYGKHEASLPRASLEDVLLSNIEEGHQQSPPEESTSAAETHLYGG